MKNEHQKIDRLSKKQETELVLSLILTTCALAFFYVKYIERKLVSFLQGQGWEQVCIENILWLSLAAFVVITSYLLIIMERYARENFKELTK